MPDVEQDVKGSARKRALQRAAKRALATWQAAVGSEAQGFPWGELLEVADESNWDRQVPVLRACRSIDAFRCKCICYEHKHVRDPFIAYK